jgi:hypothetical protein
VSETLREGSSQNYYRRHRITWEQGQILYGLRKILGLTPKQNILVFSHGNERLPWGLTNLVTEVILVAPDPPAWGPVPCRLEHLRRVNQQKDTLALKNQCLDGIIFLSSYHWGSKAAMIQQLCSLRPALKPGGTVAIGIEVGLNNIPHLVHFLPEEIQRLPELCQLDPVVEMQFALNEPTLNGLVEVRSNPNKRPHFIVDCHGELLSTGVLFLRKSEKPETRVGGGQTNK